MKKEIKSTKYTATLKGCQPCLSYEIINTETSKCVAICHASGPSFPVPKIDAGGELDNIIKECHQELN